MTTPEHTQESVPTGVTKRTAAELDDAAKPPESKAAGDGEPEAEESQYVKPEDYVAQLERENAERHAQERAEEDAAATIAPADGLSPKYQQAEAEYRADVAAIAADLGMPASEAEPLYHFIVNRAVEDAEHDASGSLEEGQIPGPDLANRRECETRIMRRYGQTAGAALIAGAQAAFKKLPADVQAYLDHHSGDERRLSNSPAVIAALALWGGGYHKLSKNAAAKELAKIRASKEYLSRDALTLDKAHLLGLIVSRGAGQGRRAPAPAKPAAAPTGRAKLEAEARSIRQDPGYWQNDAPNHKQLVSRMNQIMAELHPSER